MKVWIVENGIYSDRYVEGVYATIENVIAAYPIPDPIPDQPAWAIAGIPPSWHEEKDGSWNNGLDYMKLLQATEYEVKGVV